MSNAEVSVKDAPKKNSGKTEPLAWSSVIRAVAHSWISQWASCGDRLKRRFHSSCSRNGLSPCRCLESTRDRRKRFDLTLASAFRDR